MSPDQPMLPEGIHCTIHIRYVYSWPRAILKSVQPCGCYCRTQTGRGSASGQLTHGFNPGLRDTTRYVGGRFQWSVAIRLVSYQAKKYSPSDSVKKQSMSQLGQGTDRGLSSYEPSLSVDCGTA